MDDYKLKRTAMLLVQKYGKKALKKSVEVARYYLEADDSEAAKRWIEVSYAVRSLLYKESVGRTLDEIK